MDGETDLGLFGCVGNRMTFSGEDRIYSGIICNLGVTNSYFVVSLGDSIVIGCIVNELTCGIIYNCYSEQNTIGTTDIANPSYHDQRIGGIVGNAGNSYSERVRVAIINCYNNSNMYMNGGVSPTMGGIVGNVSGGNVYIRNCYNKGNQTQNQGDYSCSGGIVGEYRWSTADYINLIISNCFNSGSVMNGILGGYQITGDYSSCKIIISNCVNVGSTKNSAIADRNPYFTYNCYWGGSCYVDNSELPSGVYENCQRESINNFKSLSWYTNTENWHEDYLWDFEYAWQFVSGENNGYPVLRTPEVYYVAYKIDVDGVKQYDYDYKIGDTPLKIKDYSLEGYEFNGWNTREDGNGESYNPGDLYYENANLALFTKLNKKFILTIKYYSSNASTSTGLNISTDIGILSAEDIEYNNSITLTAETNSVEHSITITSANTSYNYFIGNSTSASNLNTFTYTWDATGDKTLSIYVYQRYTVTLNGNGGTRNNSTTATAYKRHGTTLSLSSYSFTRNGFKHIGFSSSSSATSGSFTYSTNASTTLYAIWKRNAQTLTWNGNGTVGDLLPSAYWNFAGSGGYTSTNAGSNSKYTTSTTSVSATSQVNIDEVLGYYAPIPIRRGYTFNGWYTSASGGVKVAGNDGSLLASVSGYTNSSRQWIKESNTTLYAQWTAKSYSIEYDLGLNATISSKPSSYTVNSNTTFDIPTRSGYTFSGYVVELSLDKLYNGFINLQNGTQYYYSDYSKSMYYEYLYMKDEVTYTGTLGNGVILWRTYDSNGSYDQSFSSVTLKGANNYALIVHYLGGSSETSVKFNVSTAFSISDYKLVGDLKITAKWEENMPAYFDEEGGYWYIEDGKMPQSRVADDLKTTLNSKWATLTDSENEYYFAGMTLVSKIYENNEYCKYEDDYYLVELIRWRLVYSSSQTSGYGTTTDTLAVMAEIVYIDAFSDSYLGAGAGYSSESVTEFMKNQLDVEYLVSESKSMPTFGSTSLNGTPASVSSNIFVASYDDLSNFTTNKNGTEKLGKIKFSDLAKDYLRANGKDTLYYTRDLGKSYNHIYCMNANGDRVQYKAQNYFGVQFAVKISEYACI